MKSSSSSELYLLMSNIRSKRHDYKENYVICRNISEINFYFKLFDNISCGVSIKVTLK